MRLSDGVRDTIFSIGKELKRGKKPSSSDISKLTKRTKSYITELINRLKRLGLLTKKKDGQSKRIDFTPNGWKVYHCIRILKELEFE